MFFFRAESWSTFDEMDVQKESPQNQSTVQYIQYHHQHQHPLTVQNLRQGIYKNSITLNERERERESVKEI